MRRYFAGSPGRRRPGKVERSERISTPRDGGKWRRRTKKGGVSGGAPSGSVRSWSEIQLPADPKVEGPAKIAMKPNAGNTPAKTVQDHDREPSRQSSSAALLIIKTGSSQKLKKSLESHGFGLLSLEISLSHRKFPSPNSKPERPGLPFGGGPASLVCLTPVGAYLEILAAV